MTLKRFSHLLVVLALALVVTVAPFQKSARAQSKPPAQATAQPTDLEARLAAIEKEIEEKRIKFLVPGVSLVIVKDDKVIYMKGLGLKDVERKLPVTADTLFAIGSSSKAFTALSIAMSADDGKLALDDAPKKYLPYFKMRDPETDAKITIRDLLSHRSGIDRTDLSMVSGLLNREELIQIAGMAKPTAKLGEKFLYQNVMFAAAGEIVAKAQKTTWDKFIEKRIFKPLGMKGSNTTVQDTLRSRDYSLGYTYNKETSETKSVPMREIGPAAPAGAINSSARDMAQWLRLMLSEGMFDGKRLVSEKNYKELLAQQNKVTGNIHYGLGWFLREWKGHKVIEHGGNIDGFNALVAFMPDQKLGFALLTNISDSPLSAVAMSTIWSRMLGQPETAAPATPTVDPQKEVGKYLLAEAGMTFDVAFTDGKLMVAVPGQPTYTLENVGGRRYKLVDAADGFFVTFRPVKGNESETEIYLEQPHGNYVVVKVKSDAAPKGDAAAPASNYDGPLKDLIGTYELKGGGPSVEIVAKDGKVVLVVPGQPEYPLEEKEKGKIISPVLPDGYGIDVMRDAAGQVASIAIIQPEGKFEFNKLASAGTTMTIDELMPKIITAQGGEANLRKHKSSQMTLDLALEHQGLTGTATISARAPNSFSMTMKLWALGKQIGSIDDYFDGVNAVEITSFSPPEHKAGKSLEDMRISSDFYEVLNWKTLFKSVVVTKMAKVGDEDVYIVVKTPEKGNVVTDYISARTFLLVRRDTFATSDTSDVTLPVKEIYSDHRMVDGVMIPFKTVTTIPSIGDVVATLKTAKWDLEIPESTFRPPAKK